MGFIPTQVEDGLHLFIAKMMQHIKNSMISNTPKLVVILSTQNSHLSVSSLLSAKCPLFILQK
jgi:phage terminase large subunit-like protein